MSESTRVKIIAIVMIATIVWAYFNIGSGKKNTATPGTAQTIQVVIPEAKTVSGTQLVNVEQKTKEPWGPDPFGQSETPRRQSGGPAQNLAWVLTGIMHNGQSPVAIINRRPVKLGDTVDKAKVVEIEKKSVTLEYNGKRFTLTVSKG